MNLDDLRDVPPALGALDDIAAPEPLPLWKRHLKKPDEVLDLVLGITRGRAAYESVAIDFELAWESLEMQSAATTFDQKHVGRVLRARAYGRYDADAAPDSDFYVQFDLAKLSALAEALVANRRMGLALARFQSVVKKYDESLFRLQVLLDFGEMRDRNLSR